MRFLKQGINSLPVPAKFPACMCVFNNLVKEASRHLRVFLTRTADSVPFVDFVGQKFCSTSIVLQTVVATVMSNTAPGWGTDLIEAACYPSISFDL